MEKKYERGGKKMKIALVGAFDRYNYGDILMPIIMHNQIMTNLNLKNIDFSYYGLFKSDMSECKGYSTDALSELKNKEVDVIIFVGGEVLTSRFTGMYLNTLSNKIKIFYYKSMRRLFNSFTENICRKKTNLDYLKPWIPNKNNFKTNKLIYNTVGGDLFFGTNKDNITSVIVNINSFDYVSIRESQTYNSVKSIRKDVFMFPDSVIAISKYISEKEIEKNISKAKKEFIDGLGSYFVLQVNKIIGLKNIETLTDEILKIEGKNDTKCILLPIGYAQGHEDTVPLSMINNKINNEKTIYFDYNNIYETLYILSHATLYIGTSLHGAITAISYGIPHFALTNKIKKLDDFLETWDTTDIIYSDIDKLSENYEKVSQNYNKFKKKVELQKEKMIKLVDENFQNINKIILEGKNE